jgi:hypothetical protein
MVKHLGQSAQYGNIVSDKRNYWQGALEITEQRPPQLQIEVNKEVSFL